MYVGTLCYAVSNEPSCFFSLQSLLVTASTTKLFTKDQNVHRDLNIAQKKQIEYEASHAQLLRLEIDITHVEKVKERHENMNKLIVLALQRKNMARRLPLLSSSYYLNKRHHPHASKIQLFFPNPDTI